MDECLIQWGACEDDCISVRNVKLVIKSNGVESREVYKGKMNVDSGEEARIGSWWSWWWSNSGDDPKHSIYYLESIVLLCVGRCIILRVKCVIIYLIRFDSIEECVNYFQIEFIPNKHNFSIVFMPNSFNFFNSVHTNYTQSLLIM